MILSLWGTLATEGCEKLNAWPTTTIIAAFTYMRSSSHKGFSLTNSMSTAITVNAEAQAPEDLQNWASNNRDLIAALKAKVLAIRNPTDERIIVSIEDIQKKTENDTMLEEHFWVQATLPEPNIEKFIAYIGCINCGTRCHGVFGEPLNCYKCPQIECTATHKAIHSFSISDQTGTLKVTAYGDDCERLLSMPIVKIYEHATSGNWEHFAEAADGLTTVPMFFKLGPAYILCSAGALKWNLKYVSAE